MKVPALKQILFVFTALAFGITLRAQDQNAPKSADPQLIQFAGMILTEADGRKMAVPYATVFLVNKGRGTYSDYRGFFTIVVEKGDKLEFRCIGLRTVRYTIPDTLTQDRYSAPVIMPSDTLTLPTVVIMPWPSREHFKIEFLKMDVTTELQQQAQKNLANQYLDAARKNPDMVPYGGKESANFYLRQKSREFVYIGQTPPMNIFSPLAWGQFIKAWKDGKFKSKKSDDDN